MRKKVRKSLAFLLALALVVSVMSGLGLSVSADDAQNEPAQTEEVKDEAVKETPKTEESTPKEGEKEEKDADPDAETVPEEKKDVKKAEGEGSGDESPVKDTTADPNGDQKDEPQAKPAAEEPAEPEEEPAASYLSTLSVEELYAYLTKLDDNNFAAAWKELTDSQKAEYNAYVLKMTFGDNKTTTSYEGGGAAVSMTNVAGLVSNLAASQKALRNSPARAARAAVRAATDVTLSGTAKDPVSGLYMNKWITKKDSTTDGTDYTIHLESYTTGKTTTTYSSKPCDIVLVLDQSGSMAESFTRTSRTQQAFAITQTNANVYADYKDSVYVKAKVDGEDSWIPVIVSRTNDGSYTAWIGTRKNSYEWWYEYDKSKPTYYFKTDSGEYKLVSNVNYRLSDDGWQYQYQYQGGESDWTTEDVTLYQEQNQTKYKYTYSYTYNEKTESVEITGEDNATRIPSIGNKPEFFADGVEKQLYYMPKATQDKYRRLDGLTDAVTKFVTSVESDAIKNGVDHNIAIVGYASPNDSQRNYNNTEVLTGVSISDGNKYANGDSRYFPKGMEKNGVQKSSGQYNDDVKRNALQSAKTPTGQTSISNAIDALTAYGGTQTDDGMAMASDIFAEQTQKRKEEYASGERNKIVVLFTDGVPTGSSSYWNNDVAKNAIGKAKTLKDDNTTIYTIGIFDGADATAKILQKPSTEKDKANKFMHYVSSNYPQADSMSYSGTSDKLGYYLTAADSAALNEIFSKIASEIGSSDVALNTTTQTIDKMSAEFKLPNGITTSDVKVYKVPCTGFEGETPIFDDAQKKPLSNATITVGADTVSVSGFDYSADYVDKTSDKANKGYKLLIEFPVEYKNDAWFGGNNIKSNDVGSGIYHEGDCKGTFKVPEVNRIIDYKIKAQDQTIYVTNQADLKKLLAYPTKAGTNDNYKPNGIKNKYVNITYTLKDAEDKVVGTYTIPAGESAEQGTWQAGPNWTPVLEDCTTYTWTCTVEPISEGKDALGIDGLPNKPATDREYGKDGDIKGTVHVLYPTATVEDKTIYWGEEAKVDELVQKSGWKDIKNDQTTNPGRIGTAPNVTVTPDYVGAKTPAKDGAYNVKIEVGAKNVTSVVHNMSDGITNTNPVNHTKWNCDDHAEVDNKNYDFCIHVKSKKLTVVKKVTGNMGDTNQEFKFTGGNIYDANKKKVTDEFTLKDNWEKMFKLKVGEKATVTETAAAGYTTTISDNANNAAGTANENDLTYTYNVTEKSPDTVTVTYTNDKTINPPNGIITTIAPYIIMVVLAAGAGVYFVYSRRRRNG